MHHTWCQLRWCASVQAVRGAVRVDVGQWEAKAPTEVGLELRVSKVGGRRVKESGDPVAIAKATYAADARLVRLSALRKQFLSGDGGKGSKDEPLGVVARISCGYLKRSMIRGSREEFGGACCPHRRCGVEKGLVSSIE